MVAIRLQHPSLGRIRVKMDEDDNELNIERCSENSINWRALGAAGQGYRRNYYTTRCVL